MRVSRFVGCGVYPFMDNAGVLEWIALGIGALGQLGGGTIVNPPFFPINLWLPCSEPGGSPRLIDDFLGLQGSHQLILGSPGHCEQPKEIDWKKGGLTCSHLPNFPSAPMPRSQIQLRPSLSLKGIPHRQNKARHSHGLLYNSPNSFSISGPTKFRERLPHKNWCTPSSSRVGQLNGFSIPTSGTML